MNRPVKRGMEHIMYSNLTLFILIRPVSLDALVFDLEKYLENVSMPPPVGTTSLTPQRHLTTTLL